MEARRSKVIEVQRLWMSGGARLLRFRTFGGAAEQRRSKAAEFQNLWMGGGTRLLRFRSFRRAATIGY